MARPDLLWNSTDTPYPDDLCIHELFESQVVKSPQSIALISNEKTYSYQEINNQANQLARVLQNRGVKNESIVGCYLTRSSAIIIFTLAIMKAGGTYILLDSTMPAPRLEYIITDADPLFVLTDTESPHLSANMTQQFMPTDQLMVESQTHQSDNLRVDQPNTNAAYISYTSGSTGRPKGVVITHKSTVNHACAFRNTFKLTPSDRIPMMSPIAFDMAIEEMIPPLVSGCTLIVSSPTFSSMEQFHNECLDNAYTILNLPAPLWHEWTDYMLAGQLNIPENLRIVIVGSEEIDTKSYINWKGLVGSDALDWIAAYGTTETTVTSTFYLSAASDDLSDEPFIPIGKPIANTYLYILDDTLHDVEVGSEGDLYIGGQGLARGYYNRPKLTDKKFISNPFRSELGARMYKTGDMARYREDGNIVWLGRSDSQFKLHGLRIEPGEIEAALNKSDSVEESVVILKRTGKRASDKQIVAFVTIEAGQIFNEAELRKIATEHLPKLMVPSQFVHLPSLPLNVNGKIDRKALENIKL